MISTRNLVAMPPVDQLTPYRSKPPQFIQYINHCLLITFLLSSGRADEPSDKDLVQGATKVLIEKKARQDVAKSEIARNWTRTFIGLLDPKKMHFLVSDENRLLDLGEKICEDAQRGEFAFAIDTVELFCKRVNTNSTAIREHLASAHDFNLEESMALTYGESPMSETESSDRWRKRIKYELLIETQAGMDLAAARKFLAARYETIQDHYNNLDQSNDFSIYIDALAKSLDPHACYFDSKTLASFRTGIVRPVTLGFQTHYRCGDLWVRSVDNKSAAPAQRLIGKRIVAVTAEGKDTIHISGLTPDAAYYTLYSPIGDLGFANRVKIEVDDPRTGERFSVVLNRFPDRNED